ncbi:hypothetical protein AXF42_Ash000565 [Apostasia shenzhenica]|uniref:MI domain-containing protein n=1 Tax=Apostasia shenzhenica TaxID=1088818 RepID=A0A2I0AGR2_9ASPA|nr:hypothetical protein AXF42_Ash000565 [Apostasia shenzhenica]
MEGVKARSRKDRRKEARLDKRMRRCHSWVQHQSGKRKNVIREKELKKLNVSQPSSNLLNLSIEKKSKSQNSSSQPVDKVNKSLVKNPKSNFHEYLQMELRKGAVNAEEDSEMELRLAKKLKVKAGKLGGVDDGLNLFIEGIASGLDPAFNDFRDVEPDDVPNEEMDEFVKGEIRTYEDVASKDEVKASNKDVGDITKSKKRKRRKSSKSSTKHVETEFLDVGAGDDVEQHVVLNEEHEALDMEEMTSGTSVKYIAPHLRACSRSESEEHAQVRRRVRGLLNRLSESNVESITGEVAEIFQTVTRSAGCEIIGEEVVASCVEGPRGNEHYAAVFAAFVAGLACLVGIDFSAKLIVSVAKSFEDEYHKEDGLSLRNLTLLLSFFYIFGICSSDLIYDLLDVLSQRLTELDVSTILTFLQCCGMKLRGDEPSSMKDFVLNIQNRVNEIKSHSQNKQEGHSTMHNKRMEFMLETICDIKNNKKRSKEDPAHHVRIKKWLLKLRAEDVLLRGLTWKKLLDPEKKGQWWLSGENASSLANLEDVAGTINKEVQEAQKLVQLATAQRMNTDIRRAIFCIIMSGEDYVDTFEKILRLGLSGKQDREIMRVIVECCLQEKLFNKYYTVLASKFCGHDKNHKFTLQVCVLFLFSLTVPCNLRSINRSG